MNTVQLFFTARNPKDDEVREKVQIYLAALLHNGQIVGDHTPLALLTDGVLVTASLPETDALSERFGNKWVRKRLRELAAAGIGRPKVTDLGLDRVVDERAEPARTAPRQEVDRARSQPDARNDPTV
jgi:predicted  nucleic acid-binding Zn ribbon protein